MKTIDKIKKYFKTERLAILDNGVAMFKNKYYNAVSFDYIYEYVLRKRVTKKYAAKQLFELCKLGEVIPVPCDYANGGDLVFHKALATGYYFENFPITPLDEIIYYQDDNEKINKSIRIFNELLA